MARPRTSKRTPAKAGARRAKAKANAKPAAKPRSPSKPKRAAKAKAAPRAKPSAKTRAASKTRPGSKTKAGSRKPAPRPPAANASRRAPERRHSNEAALVESGVPSLPQTQSSTGTVVHIIDADDPIAALRAFLDQHPGELTVQQGQIALGAAQLMLLPFARFARDPHDRQGRHDPADVEELLDLVLSRWGHLPDRTGFHAQELLRNALAAEGLDRDRLGQLVALIPHDAGAELRFNLACAYAALGDQPAMLRAARAALAAGTSPAEFLRDGDFADYANDAELQALLERATPPEIAVDIRPHVVIVRASLDALISTLREYGETVKLEPPATLDNILAAERARRIQLPNDYRALLTISDGLLLWDHQFFGTLDYRTDTTLAKRARDYLEMSAKYGATGIEDCVPLANWGQPNDWLLYDPFGRYRDGEPGLVLMLNADERVIDGVAEALEQFDEIARDVLGTN